MLTLNKKIRFSADDLQLYSGNKYSALRVIAAKNISNSVSVCYEQLITVILTKDCTIEIFHTFWCDICRELCFKNSCGASDTASREALWVLIEPYKQEAEKMWNHLHNVAPSADNAQS